MRTVKPAHKRDRGDALVFKTEVDAYVEVKGENVLSLLSMDVIRIRCTKMEEKG